MKIRIDDTAITRMQGMLIVGILVVVAALSVGTHYYSPSTPRKQLMVDFWYTSAYPQSGDQAAVYKAQLERTGLITVNLHTTDYPTFKQNRAAESMPVFMGGWYPDYIDPDNYIYPLLHSQGAGWLHTNYRNPKVDRLIEQARAASDPMTRNDLYSEIQKIMVEDAPIVPLAQIQTPAVTKADVRGVVLDITENMRYWVIESPRETLIVGTTESVGTNVDVAEAYDFMSGNVIMNTGAGLVYAKPGSPAGPEDLMPGLATSWSSSPDGLTWTFQLRQGVKFSDGAEFDANAVKYSFDRSLSLYLPDGPQAAIGYKDIIDSVEVASKYQVVFHLKFAFAPFPSLMTFQGSFIVNPEYAPIDKSVNYVEGDARASNPNDLGPYLLTSWIRKAGKDYEMRYDVNPNYWGIADGYPKTRHVVIKFYSDETALASAIKSGDIDIAYKDLTLTDVKSLQADPTVRVLAGKGGTYTVYIAFQEKTPPFDNPKVRRAIAAALDRKELVDTVFLGQAVPLYSLIPNGMAFHEDAYEVLGDANISLTVSILQELGYG